MLNILYKNLCRECNEELVQENEHKIFYWCNKCETIRRSSKYIQYIYHFSKRDSIDVRTITKDDMEWCRQMLNYGPYNNIQNTIFTVKDMLTEHFPEELV